MSPFRPEQDSDAWSLSRKSLGSYTTLVDSSIYTQRPPAPSSNIVATHSHPQISAQRPQAIRYNNREYRQEQLLYGIGAWAGSTPGYPAQQNLHYAAPEYAPTTGLQTNSRTSPLIYATRYPPISPPFRAAVHNSHNLTPIERFHAETPADHPFHMRGATFPPNSPPSSMAAVLRARESSRRRPQQPYPNSVTGSIAGSSPGRRSRRCVPRRARAGARFLGGGVPGCGHRRPESIE